MCFMKNSKAGLRLVIDNTRVNNLEKILDDKGVKPSESKSTFVRQMSSFCDELDKQIEQIMNM